MTLVVCFQGKDGVVLATDSRGTVGDPRELTAIRDTEVKLFKLSNYVGIMSFGNASIAAQLISEIKSKIKSDGFIDQVMQLTRETIRQLYNNWFAALDIKQKPIVGFIMGGFNEKFETKSFYLTSPFDFAPQLATAKVSMGGIPQYATYLVHRLHNPKMKIKHLIPLAVYIISETATQDPKVGGPIRLATITKGKGYKELEEGEIIEVIKQNEEHSKKLREFFFS